jgi:hypothetical protein
LAKQLHKHTIQDHLQSPGDQIFLDIIESRERASNGRGYSLETLRRAWAIQQQSPTAWNIVRQTLPLPCEHSLESHFVRTGVVLSKALVDLDQVRELVNLCDQSSPDTAIDCRVSLSVDAVAFRPKVTITSDGEVVALDDLNNLESPDLFEQFLLRPQKFTAFLRDH